MLHGRMMIRRKFKFESEVLWRSEVDLETHETKNCSSGPRTKLKFGWEPGGRTVRRGPRGGLYDGFPVARGR